MPHGLLVLNSNLPISTFVMERMNFARFRCVIIGLITHLTCCLGTGYSVG